jgi:hypothetical protein
MSILNLRSVAIGGALVAMCSQSGLAQPTGSPDYGRVTPFACDAREQIAEVVQALQTHSLIALGKQLKMKNETVCLFSIIGPDVA